MNAEQVVQTCYLLTTCITMYKAPSIGEAVGIEQRRNQLLRLHVVRDAALWR